MEQETRKFAIAQAILLISSRQDITDKTKAVFDLADQIVKYIGVARKNEHVPFKPMTPIFSPPPTIKPKYPIHEVLCKSGSTEQTK